MLRLGMTQRRAILLGILAAVWLFPTVAVRAQTGAEARAAEFDRAFHLMLRDPSNLDKTFKYAELGIK